MDEDMIDLPKVRRETPGVDHRIHLNNAGAALMPLPVYEAVTNYLERELQIGGYETSSEKVDELNAVYDSVATLIGSQRDEIAIAENATVAWQRAFYSLDFKEGDRILTTQSEYAANYIAYLQIAKRFGTTIDVIPNDGQGALDPTALERMIDGKVRLIAITWVPTNGGLVNPAEEVGRIANAHGITYLLDACQAVGQMPIDVTRLGCDILTATGRKFLRGPRGTGFLYIKKELLARTEPIMLDLFSAQVTAPHAYTIRPDARRFETWETNYSTRAGLRAACDYALDIGLSAIESRCRHLTNLAREQLAEIRGVKLHDLGAHQSAIISFTISNHDSASIMKQLAGKAINVSVSNPSSTPLDADARHLPPIVRVSPHYYNTEEDIGALIAAVRTIAAA